jgi:hypothetical protein
MMIFWSVGQISHTDQRNPQPTGQHSGPGIGSDCQRFAQTVLLARENVHPTFDKNIPAGHHGSTFQKLE